MICKICSKKMKDETTSLRASFYCLDCAFSFVKIIFDNQWVEQRVLIDKDKIISIVKTNDIYEIALIKNGQANYNKTTLNNFDNFYAPKQDLFNKINKILVLI